MKVEYKTRAVAVWVKESPHGEAEDAERWLNDRGAEGFVLVGVTENMLIVQRKVYDADDFKLERGR